MALQDLNKLCSPAQLYLFLTLLTLIVMVFQNNGTYENVLCVGNYECHNAPNKMALVFVKLIYIAFWTFVLNLMCRGGYKNLAWFLVLFPILLSGLLLVFAVGPWTHKGILFEGFSEGMDDEADDEMDGDVVDGFSMRKKMKKITKHIIPNRRVAGTPVNAALSN
jgi:hypothetical protein